MSYSKMMVVAALAGVAGLAQAQQTGQPLVEVALTSGDTLSGAQAARTDESITIEHPVLGVVTLPMASVASVTETGVVIGGDVQGDGDGQATIDAPTAQAVEPNGEEAEPLWESSLDLGLDGSEGNTEELNFRIAYNATKEIENVEKFDFFSRWVYSTADGDTTDNDFYTRALQQWFLPESPRWSYFLQGAFEMDQFQAWNARLSGFAGMGYKLIDDEETTLTGRVGLGGAYEFRSDENEAMPEALLGMSFAHAFNDRTRFTSSVDFFPDLGEFGKEFRTRSDAALEVDLTDAGDWRLRTGIEHEYESDTSERNWDLDYYVTLSLAF